MVIDAILFERYDLNTSCNNFLCYVCHAVYIFYLFWKFINGNNVFYSISTGVSSSTDCEDQIDKLEDIFDPKVIGKTIITSTCIHVILKY